jgi:diacylglycerol kinase (ATP)
MDDKSRERWRRRGVRRLLAAVRHQLAGLREGLLHDAAIREVSVVVVALCLGALWLPVARVEKLLLVVATMQVAVLEYVNSAIEATVDRVSTDPHPLARIAKDFGSVAVGGSALIAFVCWATIAGPLLLARLGF